VNKILVHACCALCAGPVIEKITDMGLKFSIYFYNPNIQPKAEYITRMEWLRSYCKKKQIEFIEGGYDIEKWRIVVKGLGNEPEGGKRCQKCFEFRFSETAKHALENNYDTITTTLNISRRKNMNDIFAAGKAVEKTNDKLRYWKYDWRKKGGSDRIYQIAKEENFYRQKYCGCQQQF
jgi:epoxyqueuosine reductase